MGNGIAMVDPTTLSETLIFGPNQITGLETGPGNRLMVISRSPVEEDLTTFLSGSETPELELSLGLGSATEHCSFQNGELAVVEGNSIRRYAIDASMNVSTMPSITGLNSPVGVDHDGTGNLYFSEVNDHHVRRWDSGSGSITLAAGMTGNLGDGLNLLNSPRGVFITGSCDLWVASLVADQVKKFGFNSPLAVDWGPFYAYSLDGVAMLEWSTYDEADNHHFDVERSTDGRNFTKIGEVAAASDGTGGSDYAFIDSFPASGNNIYRLKQWDNDLTTFDYSIMRSATFGVPVTFGVSLSPNPATNYLTVEIPEDSRIHMLRVSGVNGQPIVQTVPQGTTIVNFDITGLPAGFYALVALDERGEFMSAKKLTVQR